MTAALKVHGTAIAPWAALATLRDRRERADYRPGDAPSHDEAKASVLAALAILSTDLPAAG